MADAVKKLPADEFLKFAEELPVIDVRSPGEYSYGHIPGAVNIPLFDDGQRAEVGTIYKQEGSLKAVLRGIDLAAPEMSLKLKSALSLTSDGRLLVHCWRGGMRSEAIAWLFSLGGINPLILEGGYKAYRKFILDELGKPRRYTLLGGLTGSGKTHILHHMALANNQVTDLEGLACHRGSAFGALGQPAQPSSEHFANLLYASLYEKNPENIIWLEDESRNIGTVFMPDNFYNRMQESHVIALMMSIDTRMPRLLAEYSAFPAEFILASVLKISKRLGGDRTKEAVAAVERKDFSTAIRITLEYYDRAYSYSLSKRKSGQVIYIETDTDDIDVNAGRVLAAAANVK
ncbi:MAG TPA: tRNA 2-selenouridine(34) synthase MnmH [Bacteroidales bacterium]|nr:tRNA 2-selenouridine(34) synthase MnmH [Bacteroidales bacterium]